jgi:hypothetical protein
MNKYDKNYLKNNLEILNKNYLKFLLCYNLYIENNNLRNKDLLWEEKAKNNLDLMNKYKSFFWFFDFWTLDLAIIELNKIFSQWDDINIYKIIKYIFQHRKAINKLKKEKFLDKCYELQKTTFKNFSIEEIIEIEWWIKEIKDDFEKVLDKKIKNIENKLEDLLNSRHNRSHNLKKLKKTNLKFIDIDEIQKLFEEVFNIIHNNLSNWVYDFSYFKDNTKKDFNLLFKNLSDFYKIRSLFFDNYLKKLWKTDEDIYNEIKQILKIDFM